MGIEEKKKLTVILTKEVHNQLILIKQAIDQRTLNKILNIIILDYKELKNLLNKIIK